MTAARPPGPGAALAHALPPPIRGRSPGPPSRRFRARLRRARDGTLRAVARADAGLSEATGSAYEWLVDNRHVVVRAADQVLEDLPAGFHRVLPRLERQSDRRRVEELGAGILESEAGLVDAAEAQRFVEDFQTVSALDTAELWALPAFLRLLILERLLMAVQRASTGDEDGRKVGAYITSLRALDHADWATVVEESSLVDRCFRSLDPGRAYAHMDRGTRDRYRQAVEELARWSGRAEVRVATECVRAAGGAGDDHVGALLVGRRRREFEAELGARVPAPARFRRFVFRHVGKAYAALIGGLTLGALALPLTPLLIGGIAPSMIALAGTLLLLPAVSIAVATANTLVTRTVPPRRLPKLDLRQGIPRRWRTCVAVPAIFRDPGDVPPVLQTLEANYRGNVDENLVFALLADLPDADAQTQEGDAAILAAAEEGIRALNNRFGQDAAPPFLLLTRPRRWNPRQGRWMGWERKRGKLHEFDRLLRSDPSVDLQVRVGRPGALEQVQFVLTLDADTFVPRGAAARLVGTLAHPLNRPRFDADGQVRRGYTVLQPRVETLAGGEEITWFTRLFQADEGLDLYSHAVSDAYQDLFGEGVYVGKGLYDVDAFEKSLAGRAPENALLSHDLFEGIHGRTALVSDVALHEHFPATPAAWMRRHHRWVRGDWQLLPWLSPRVPSATGEKIPGRFSPLGWWLVFDNLRRSLVFPSLLLLAAAGCFLLPGPAWWWTGWVVAFPGAPILLKAAGGVPGRIRRWPTRAAFRRSSGPGLVPLGRWAAQVTFMAWQALEELGAVGRTLYRVFVSRRHLLQWTSAAHTDRFLGSGLGQSLTQASPSVVVGAAFGFGLWIAPPDGAALPVALVGLWLIAPLVAWVLGRPRRPRRESLSPADRIWLRRLARRTWGYFEWLMNPEDHWLPPDNVQFVPDRGVAHRTSPTNIGMGLISVAAAHELGHVTLSRTSAVLTSLFETLARLERYRGHFLNWYNTRNLHTLAPRYVSSVDSGNLAASLVLLPAALADFGRVPFPRRADVLGLADTMEVVAEVLGHVGIVGEGTPCEALIGLARELRGKEKEPFRLPDLVDAVLVDALPRLENATATFLEGNPTTETARVVAVRRWLTALHTHLAGLEEEARLYLPWRHAVASPPSLVEGAGTDSATGRAWDELLDSLPRERSLEEAGSPASGLRRPLAALRRALEEQDDSLGKREAMAWLNDLEVTIEAAAARARALRGELVDLSASAGALLQEMEFRFLYDEDRRLLHIGYDVDAAALDRSHYDLFASEARLASYVGMAKGEIPTEHWLELGRPFGRREGATLLLSWAGTMFEYLMPVLFLRLPEESFSHLACRRAVGAQIAFGARHGIPWGVSESGYAELDAHGSYRYRAFGVPELALRHDPGGDPLVVAPYATALALPLRPLTALRNLRKLSDAGLMGSVGLMEALDFGSQARRREPRVVQSAMAHHQGMTLAAVHHVLTDGAMPRRFHRDGTMAALSYLLLEEAPGPVRITAAPPPPPPTFLPDRPVQAPPWAVDPSAFPPSTMVLSNGSLSSLVTAAGGGGLRWKGRDVLRWRPDATVQGHGLWIYLRDAGTDRLRSVARAPTWAPCERDEVLFSGESVEFLRDEGPLKMRMDITVAPWADVEIRKVSVVNEGDRDTVLEVTSFAEVALADPAEDRRHPAFARLFVQAEFDSTQGALVFRRRGEGLDERPLFMAHAVSASPGELLGWETDRSRFLRRGGDLRRPPGAVAQTRRSGRERPWYPLDPVASLGWRLPVPAGGEATLTFLTAAGSTRAEVLEAVAAHRTPGSVAWAFQQSREVARDLQEELELRPGELATCQRLLTALAFPFHGSRAPGAAPLGRTEGASRDALWSVGVSGDLPVLTVRVSGPEPGDALAPILRAHAYWERKGAEFDLVVIDAGSGDLYGDPVGARLNEALTRAGRIHRLGVRGGVHHVPAGRLPPGTAARIEAASSVVVVGDADSLAAALEGLERGAEPLPPFVAVPSGPLGDHPTDPVERPVGLDFDNGLGGFPRGETGYVLHLEPDARPPAPWINVIANEDFGFTASEAGTGFTWDRNSGERRLTPWSNDPVLDPAGEALYLRDEETGEVWSPAPGPAVNPASCRVTHRPGRTTYLTGSHGLEQEVEMALAGEDRSRVTEVRLRNRWPRPRRLTLTCYVEWVLGSRRSVTAPHLVTAFDRKSEVLVARNDFEAAPVGFLASDRAVHGFTCDRTEFLGQEGRRDLPAALERIGLSGSEGRFLDPCAALQVHVDLDPDAEARVRFFIGAADETEEVPGRVERLRDPDFLAGERSAGVALWDDLLGRTTVRTPERSMDLLLNGWLRYQALACRLWGRSGFYQSSGAFGFRDQLQDGLGLLSAAPQVARERILDAASRQFTGGDVLHWWHPNTGAGVRTRCSDDLHWLPFVVAAYVETTGDEGLLDEEVPFLQGAALAPDELERYHAFEPAKEGATLHEHCLRALNRAGVLGPRGVPLIGSGDWNDGLNRVGIGGRGESFWLGWFLARVFQDYARVCDRRGEERRGRDLRERARALGEANETHAWDGAWYRRATYDDGAPMGSAVSDEGKLDSLPQSWAVLSGVADPDRARTGMTSVWRNLVDHTSRLVLLLTPPFQDTPRHPGYIKSYPPGVRENGGQYTHAATWVGWAYAASGDGDRAEEVFRLLNPILRTATPDGVASYRTEPYVLAGDVYGGDDHRGRGGWTWYTGSASWLYRLGVEAILGLRFRPDSLVVDPCIPRSWRRFVVKHRHGGSSWHILVRNPARVSNGVGRVTVDGEPLEGSVIPLKDDGGHHHVVVTLGP